jgi:hypothetical protein
VINHWNSDMNPAMDPRGHPSPDPHQVEPVTCGHDKGCLCGRCAEHRARLVQAVTGAENAVMAIGQADATARAAAAGIRAQIEAARVAAAVIRAQIEAARVAAAVAEAGAYRERYREPSHPYTMDETEPCYGITGPAVSAGRAMTPGTGAVRIRQERPGVWVPDPDGDHQVRVARAQAVNEATAYWERYRQAQQCDMAETEDEPGPPAQDSPPEDEAVVMWRSFFEPMFLSPAELDRQAPFAPAGSCSSCRLPAVAGKPMCPYCAALNEIRARSARGLPSGTGAVAVEAELASRALSCTHGPKAAWVRNGYCTRCGRYAIRPARSARPALAPAHPHRAVRTRLVLLGIGVTLAVLAAHGLHPLLLPAIALAWLALSGLRR